MNQKDFIKSLILECIRCGHVWQKRNLAQNPKVCPKCKNTRWNIPRKNSVTLYRRINGEL
jgi:rubrerythrin